MRRTDFLLSGGAAALAAIAVPAPVRAFLSPPAAGAVLPAWFAANAAKSAVLQAAGIAAWTKLGMHAEYGGTACVGAGCDRVWLGMLEVKNPAAPPDDGVRSCMYPNAYWLSEGVRRPPVEDHGGHRFDMFVLHSLLSDQAESGVDFSTDGWMFYASGNGGEFAACPEHWDVALSGKWKYGYGAWDGRPACPDAYDGFEFAPGPRMLPEHPRGVPCKEGKWGCDHPCGECGIYRGGMWCDTDDSPCELCGARRALAVARTRGLTDGSPVDPGLVAYMEKILAVVEADALVVPRA